MCACVCNKAFKNYGQQATGAEECALRASEERDAKQLAVDVGKYATKNNRPLCECVCGRVFGAVQSAQIET